MAVGGEWRGLRSEFRYGFDALLHATLIVLSFARCDSYPIVRLTVDGYGGVVLAPGNMLAVYFSNITVPEKGVNISG